MTAADIIDGLLLVNLSGSLAILAVLALRGLVRRAAGAHVAYLSWLAVPAVVAACLIPARIVTIEAPAPAAFVPAPAPYAAAVQPADAPSAPITPQLQLAPAPVEIAPLLPTGSPAATTGVEIDWALGLVLVWAAVAIGALVLLAFRQALAVRALGPLTRVTSNMFRAARFAIGPAVVGALAPRIILPSDFETAFDDTERKVVIAHEEAHLRGRHTTVKAAVEIAVCINWFNPLVYLAARAVAMDQELACDETVVRRYPEHRKAYATVLLKHQNGPRAPLGCYWPAGSAGSLRTRITQMKHPVPGRRRRIAGGAILALAAAIAAGAAWASRPPQTHIAAPAPRTSEPELKLATPSSPPTATLQSIRLDEPQPAPSPQTPAPSTAGGFDPTDPIYLRGKVERIDFGETKYTVFVRASSIAHSEYDEAKPDARLWELPPTPYWGDRDAVNADLEGSFVLVRGYAPKDKSCIPACKLLSRGILVPKSVELQPSANFGVAEFNQAYDVNQRYVIVGHVERIEFSDRTFDAYVRTRTDGPPSSLFQVRSEYRIPRADIERQLLDQDAQITGWPARANFRNADLSVWTIYSNCIAACAMYGESFMLPNGTRVLPLGEVLEPVTMTSPPRATFPILPFGTRPGISQELSSAQRQYEEISARSRNLNAQIEAGRSIDAIPEALTSPAIAALLRKQADLKLRKAEIERKYAPRHPEYQRVDTEIADVRRRMDAELSRLQTSLEEEAHKASDRLRALYPNTDRPIFTISPFVLTGKVTAAESYGTGVKLTVEEITRNSAPFVGMGPGTSWSVYLTPALPGVWPIGDRGNRWIGRTATFSGVVRTKFSPTAPPALALNSLKDCVTSCDLTTSDALPFD